MTEWWSIVAPRLHTYLAFVAGLSAVLSVSFLLAGEETGSERLSKLGLFMFPLTFLLGLISCLCA